MRDFVVFRGVVSRRRGVQHASHSSSYFRTPPLVGLGCGTSGSGADPGLDPDAASDVDSSMNTGADGGSGADAADSSSRPDATDAAPADAALPPPVSCTTPGDGRSNCGSGSESCCTSLTVTGSATPYNRTYNNLGPGPTGVADPATVSDFRLDKYEVTVGRFRKFVAAWNGGSGWTPPAASGKHTHLNGGQGLAATANDAGLAFEPGWATSDNGSISPTDVSLACNPYKTWTPSSAGGHEKLPINCVNWWEAYAFCIWDGGFLPSEAEWEYAAAGGSESREYPWGTTTPGASNVYAIHGCDYPSSTGSCTDVSNIAPVGTPTAGAGKYGQLDLAGNLTEWNLDWYASGYTSCTNCTDATSAAGRVIRGGSFSDLANSYSFPPYRFHYPPSGNYGIVGFRCARTP